MKKIILFVSALFTINFCQTNCRTLTEVEDIDPHEIEYYDGATKLRSAQSNSFSMDTYFSNLYEYSPDNVGVSCGFVSLIQYLSYIDTYINDSFIPESYEKTKNASSIQNALLTSPGVKSNDWQYDEVGNLRQYINYHLTDDFQCFLMELYSYHYLFEGDNDPDRAAIGLWKYQYIFDELAVYGMPEIPYYYSKVNQQNKEYLLQSNITKFDRMIKDKLDQGEPVILNIAEENIDDFNHAVVAYDYDQNGIYCNYGWGQGYTHKVLPDDVYVYAVGYLDLSSVTHKHSNNYNVNGQRYCGCGAKV